jgi:hypothetical protein
MKNLLFFMRIGVGIGVKIAVFFSPSSSMIVETFFPDLSLVIQWLGRTWN